MFKVWLSFSRYKYTAKIYFIEFNLDFQVAVVPCSMPEIINDPKSTSNDRNGLIGVPGAVDRPQRPPILPGDYFQATTTLKVKITLACPFVPLDKAPRMSPLPNQVRLHRYSPFLCIYNVELL